MTLSGEAAPPRRIWPRLLGWSCLTLATVGFVTFFASMCYVYVSHGAEARKINEHNMAAVSPILPALDAYRRANGRYPKSLCDLPFKQLPHFERARIRYSSSDNGADYWLEIFPWFEAGFFFPSDRTREYSSTSRTWREMDVTESTAKNDYAWANGCTADTMTTTR